MNLLQQFQLHIKEQNLFLQNHRLLIAVSGGIDSVVLCALCKQAGYAYSIAHCNFGLRGEESNRDEQFVLSFGERLGAEVFIRKFDTTAFATAEKISIQEAARNLRYDWFASLKKDHGFDYVLLAHHADDNIETVLIHFFRGTGLQGLTGIPQIRDQYFVRPLLSFRRKDIEAFAKEQGLQWVEDASNSSDKYTRNFFRLELLPAIKKVFPQADENLLRNIERMQTANALYRFGYEELKNKLVEKEGNTVKVPVLKLLPYLHTSFLFEWVSEYGFSEKQLTDIRQLLRAENGRFVQSENFQIIRHNRWLIIAPKNLDNSLYVIEEGQTDLAFSNGVLLIRKYPKDKWRLNTAAIVAQLDIKEIRFPLVLRRWKSSDYFYPLGMRKKKKLARFFIDLKLSKDKKEQAWVLESDKRIIWVAGFRIDDRFKVTESTKEILELQVKLL